MMCGCMAPDSLSDKNTHKHIPCRFSLQNMCMLPAALIVSKTLFKSHFILLCFSRNVQSTSVKHAISSLRYLSAPKDHFSYRISSENSKLSRVVLFYIDPPSKSSLLLNIYVEAKSQIIIQMCKTKSGDG